MKKVPFFSILILCGLLTACPKPGQKSGAQKPTTGAHPIQIVLAEGSLQDSAGASNYAKLGEITSISFKDAGVDHVFSFSNGMSTDKKKYLDFATAMREIKSGSIDKITYAGQSISVSGKINYTTTVPADAPVKVTIDLSHHATISVGFKVPDPKTQPMINSIDLYDTEAGDGKLIQSMTVSKDQITVDPLLAAYLQQVNTQTNPVSINLKDRGKLNITNKDLSFSLQYKGSVLTLNPISTAISVNFSDPQGRVISSLDIIDTKTATQFTIKSTSKITSLEALKLYHDKDLTYTANYKNGNNLLSIDYTVLGVKRSPGSSFDLDVSGESDTSAKYVLKMAYNSADQFKSINLPTTISSIDVFNKGYQQGKPNLTIRCNPGVCPITKDQLAIIENPSNTKSINYKTLSKYFNPQQDLNFSVTVVPGKSITLNEKAFNTKKVNLGYLNPSLTKDYISVDELNIKGCNISNTGKIGPVQLLQILDLQSGETIGINGYPTTASGGAAYVNFPPSALSITGPPSTDINFDIDSKNITTLTAIPYSNEYPLVQIKSLQITGSSKWTLTSKTVSMNYLQFKYYEKN